MGPPTRLSTLLARRTSGRKLIPEVDGLRSIAILSVVFFHANANFSFYAGTETHTPLDRALVALLHTGEYGVPLFFAISGFILALPFASHHLEHRDPPSIRKYLLRRLTRLEPPYVFCLLVLAALRIARTGALTSNDGTLTDTLKHLAANIFYLHTPIYGQHGAISPVAWSLEVEVQFYLLAPLLCTVFALPRLTRRIILVAATLAFSYFFGVEKPIDGPTVLHQAPYFLVGLLLGDFYLTRLRDHARPSPYWNAVAVAAIAGVFLFKAANIAPAITTPWLILAGYYAVFQATSVRRFFAATPVVILGGMCYTIYLWHFLVIAGFRHPYFMVVDPAATWPMRILYILAASAAAIAFSAVLFALIERPTMDPKWPQKLAALLRLRRPPPPQPPQGPSSPQTPA